MRWSSRVATLAAVLGLTASPASGYYNWAFFPNAAGPYTSSAVARIDLSQVSDNTVPFFISDQGPNPMMPGDTFPALISQIRAAAAVWSKVPTSGLRLTFGGMETIGQTPQNSPGIDVVFDDNMPPGLLAQTRLSLPQDLGYLRQGGSFVPIGRSKVQLRKDLTVYSQASHFDSFFLTIVHEFGHAIGLQHTLTSGVMSTDVTRATTKAAPLSADDMAGISMLYPAGGFAASTGSMTGTVKIGGSGVNLASVVALSNNAASSNYGVAISTLTNPDGTFNMVGLPPGQYYVYAQPLPPAVSGESTPYNIIPPEDASGNVFPANTGMDTQFFGDTRDWTQASIVTVTAGAATPGVNFVNMQPRSAASIYGMETYAYLPPGPTAVPVPAPPLISGSRLYLVFRAPGTTVAGGTAITPGLSVNPIGSFAQTEAGTLKYWTQGFNEVVLDTGPVNAPTPVALAVTAPNKQFGSDLYILPSAFTVVSSTPPLISGITSTGASDAAGDPIVTLTGTNLSASTRVIFDGASATILTANEDGSLTVAAPPATGAYVASVEALNPDGQTSLQWLGITPAPLQFTYAAPNPAVVVNIGVLQQGGDSEVDIIGTNTAFLNGQVSVGFGTSDIQVRRLWVFGTNRLLMDVSVKPGAQPGPVTLTVASGLQMETLSGILQILPSGATTMSLRYPILNSVTGLDGLQAGGGLTASAVNVPQNLAGWTLWVNGEATSPGTDLNGRLRSVVPVDVAQGGPAIAYLQAPDGQGFVPPLVMQVDTPVPQIVGLVDANGNPISASNPAHQGDPLTLVVSGLADAGSSSAPAPGQVQIVVAEWGGTETVTETASALVPGTQPGLTMVQFTLVPNAPYGSQQTMTVGLGTRISGVLSNLVILPTLAN